MVKKVLWALVALLAALVGLYGVVRLGWTWQLFIAAAGVALSLVLAIFSGEQSMEEQLEAAYNEVEAEGVVVEEVLDDSDPAPVSLADRITRRFKLADIAPILSDSAEPTEF